MRLIDADELLRYIESKGRLSGVAEIVKNDIIRNIYKMMQPQSAQAQPKPNKLDDVNDVDKLLQLAVDTGLQPGVIYKAPAEWKQPNKLDEMIDYHEGEDMAGNKVSIYPIFREINRQLKELRGERD